MGQGGDDTSLQRSVARALGLLALHEGARQARAQSLGLDVALPDLDEPAGDARDAERLAPLGPLYMAHELEQAGLLRAAELIAGIFASGAIQQPLGKAAEAIGRFWHARRSRLTETERAQLLEHTFEASVFYPRMDRLCAALAALADNADGPDPREEAGLEAAASDLAEMLVERAGGMVAFAAADILAALQEALSFLRDPQLQSAFGVRDLWSLVASAGVARGIDPVVVRRHGDLAREGASVLVWLAHAVPVHARLDPADAQGRAVIFAAVRWRLARESLPRYPDARTAARPPIAP